MEENFKQISFHDCLLDNLKIINNKLFLYISMDVDWFHGKKIGILTLDKFENAGGLIREFISINMNFITKIQFTKSKISWRVQIELEGKPTKKFEITAKHITYRRVDKYVITKAEWEKTAKHFPK